MKRVNAIFEYLKQIMLVFGFMMLLMCVFCMMFGEDAQSVSMMFELGGRGLSVNIILQYFCVAVLTIFFKMIFFDDRIIQNMPIVVRTICSLTAEFILIILFIVQFDWFPIDMWEAWVMFLLCFSVSCLVSIGVSIKEKNENKKMEEALKKLKEERGLHECD